MTERPDQEPPRSEDDSSPPDADPTPSTASEAPSTDDACAPPIATPREVGRYTIHRLIASGGMGSVFLARQEKPQRTVALKLMKSGVASRRALRRFEYESEILARLRHPHIAQVFEAGTHDGPAGRVPYFAMEYVPDAMPLTEYARRRELSLNDRLVIFGKVCDAVHHGHQKGVIHRDLKPGNILVDARGEPRIIDFGVARATDSDMAVTTLQTDVGQLIGTLQYMSPEQCGADPQDLDIRSDVYALGVVLYELLCERVPYDLSRVAIYEAARLVRESMPDRPSDLRRVLRGDVETITLKALEKDRERRYQSAADLAQDIERYLTHEPISARPPSMSYQVRMFARRHRGLVAAASSIAAILALATIVSVVFGTIALHQRDLARDTADELREANRAKDWMVYRSSIYAAGTAMVTGEMVNARAFLDAAPAEHRDWAWRYLDAITDDSLRVLEASSDVDAMVFGANDRYLVGLGADLVVWDVRSGDEVRRQALRSPTDSPPMRRSAVSPRGDIGVIDGRRIIDLQTGDAIATLDDIDEDSIVHVAISPDSSRVVGLTWDSVRVWNVTDGSLIARRPVQFEPVDRPHVIAPPTIAAISDDARFIALHDTRRMSESKASVEVWDTTMDASFSVDVVNADGVSVRFSPDAERVAVNDAAGVSVWDPRIGRRLHQAPDETILDFSPDGRRVVVATGDVTLIRDLVGGESEVVSQHHGLHYDAWFTRDGSRLIGQCDQSLCVHDPIDGTTWSSLDGHVPLDVVSSHDGRLLATRGHDGTVRLWSGARRSNTLMSVYDDDQPTFGTAIRADGRLVVVPFTTSVQVFDPLTGDRLAVHDANGMISRISVSADGTSLATLVAASDPLAAEVVVQELITGEVVGRMTVPPDTWSISLNVDGTRVIVTDGAADGEVRRTLDGAVLHESRRLGRATFVGDGRTILLGDGARLDAATFEERVAPVMSTSVAAFFGPDGATLVGVSSNGTEIRTRDRKRIVIPDPGRAVSMMSPSSHRLSLDGRRFLQVGDGRTVIHDVTTGDELWSIFANSTFGAGFSPDESFIFSADYSGVWLHRTIPYREHLQRLEARRAMETRVAPIVDALLAEQEPLAVSEALRNDPALSEEARNVALIVLMKRCEARREAARDGAAGAEPSPN